MTALRIINPAKLGIPKGYSNGVVAPAGSRLLFVAGQIGWNEEQKLAEGFVAQLAQALDNLLQVVANAGGSYLDVVRLTIYVIDKAEYLAAAKAVGYEYRERFGRHYPAMSLVEVSALLEPGARVEIEATAALPPEEAE
jgi:enamine deaminase RidA (YjgF/YER057c/UK114 family)